MPDRATLSHDLKAMGAALDFDHVGIAAAVQPPGYHPLLEWIAAGYAADMDWIPRRADAYAHPDGVLPGTRSVIVVAMNYHNTPTSADGPRIARYAWGTQDYHHAMRRRLKQLATWLNGRLPAERTRCVVDTAPLLERDFARLAGIGWFGKNTMLISREIGSWFFLGAVLTTAELECDKAFEGDFCGTCTRCLEACPTDAFPKPYQLDSSRCISYLTIERRDKPVPEELHRGIGDWLFGCDVCQEVCPWNRFAPSDSAEEFRPRPDLHELTLDQILSMDHQSFADRFKGTPLERTGRDAIVRNAAIIAGNIRAQHVIRILQQLTDDQSELVRDAAIAAVNRIQE